MTGSLGVWTYQDCALVLIDYQKEMFDTIRSETKADLAELNVRLLARTAKSFEIPMVLSTVGVAYYFNGPTLPAIAAVVCALPPTGRTRPRSSDAAQTSVSVWA
jgi:nicotinamidase-related amidase